MNATNPDCVKAVTPISANNKMIIGNMYNFLRAINNEKISLIVLNFDICYLVF